MGAEDYATSLGVMRTPLGTEIEFARARVANAALGAVQDTDGQSPNVPESSEDVMARQTSTVTGHVHLHIGIYTG
jgi:citrate lyase beta subunit